MAKTLNSRIPEGPVAEKWTNYKAHQRLVNPKNKLKLDVIVEAADSNSSALTSDTRYYTSITIEKDDTLWSIASLYAPEGVDTGRYVNDIRRVNNLHNDTITAGCSLIIYYYAGE